MQINKIFIIGFIVHPSQQTWGQNKLEINIGGKVQIFSERSYHKRSTHTFDAEGNVLIVHALNSIYGDRVHVDFREGFMEVHENVRYVDEKFTIYGSYLKYNFKKNLFFIKDARILADNYIVFGRVIEKLKDDHYIAYKAKYTTCKDCPESWTIAGDEIIMTVGEYLVIKQAYFKVKDVIVMYSPYLLFPVKTKRATGLLPLDFSLNLRKGFYFKQPFFWVISDFADLTFAPLFSEKRGFGTRWQYRQILGSSHWFEIDSLVVLDELYKDNPLRYFFSFEDHFNIGERINGHVFISDVKDLAMIGDFNKPILKNLRGSEIGFEFFFEYSHPSFTVMTESFFKKNILEDDPQKFDYRYVQMLPRISFIFQPHYLLQSTLPFFKAISLGFDGEYMRFQGDSFKEQSFIRNASRLTLTPYLHWSLGSLGPVQFWIKTHWRSQSYQFPYEKIEDKYGREGFFFKGTMNVVIAKKIDLSKKNIDTFDQEKEEKKILEASPYIGGFPKLTEKREDDRWIVRTQSYRHTQEFNIHYFLKGWERVYGNRRFQKQMETSEGRFDSRDIWEDKRRRSYKNSKNLSLPIHHILEFQWQHLLVQRTEKKLDQFRYSKLLHVNISQGVDFHVQTENFKKKFTRLAVDTHLSLKGWDINLRNYYFYLTRQHHISLMFKVSLSRWSFDFYFFHDPFKEFFNKDFKISTSLQFSDYLKFSLTSSVDIDKNKILEKTLSTVYTSKSQCWMLGFDYTKNLQDVEYSMNLSIYYNSQIFKQVQEEADENFNFK